jgi:hypothetical protein
MTNLRAVKENGPAFGRAHERLGGGEFTEEFLEVAQNRAKGNVLHRWDSYEKPLSYMY